MRLSAVNGMFVLDGVPAVDPVVMGVVVVELVPVVVVVEPVELWIPGVVMPGRGAKIAVVLMPVGAKAAVMFRICVLLTSITRKSITTSGRGLSRSAISFSTSAIVSASHRTISAFCAV